MTGRKREYEETLNSLTQRIVDADCKLQSRYPAVRCQFEFDCRSGKRYVAGFGPIRDKDRLIWCGWANEYFHEDEKRYALRKLPVRVKIDLVNSGFYETLEDCMKVEKERMEKKANKAEGRLAQFCEE